jgi:hypothetical protein
MLYGGSKVEMSIDGGVECGGCLYPVSVCWTDTEDTVSFWLGFLSWGLRFQCGFSLVGFASFVSVVSVIFSSQSCRNRI